MYPLDAGYAHGFTELLQTCSTVIVLASSPAGYSSMLALRAPAIILGWPPPADDKGETSWLDGLRGCAAALVAIYHFGLYVFMPLYYEAPYGASTFGEGNIVVTESLNDIWRLPLWRLFMHSGHAQVNIFFILSGLVLSWRPAGLMLQGRSLEAFDSLSSAIVRRWIRLFLPVMGVVMIKAVLAHFGLLFLDASLLQTTLFDQIKHALRTTEAFANPFEINRQDSDWRHMYNWDFWTIPMEFVGSLLIYVLCLSFVIFSTKWRIIITLSFTCYAMQKAHWANLSFLFGLFLTLYCRKRDGFSRISQVSQPAKISWSVALIISFIMIGVPSKSPFFTTAGWERLDRFVPAAWADIEGGSRFWWTFGTMLFLSSAIHLDAVQGFFSRPVPRYLGRLSFMLYLTHREIFVHLMLPLTPKLSILVGKAKYLDGMTSHSMLRSASETTLMYIFALLLCAPLVLIVAHWTTVIIDEPSVTLARFLDQYARAF